MKQLLLASCLVSTALSCGAAHADTLRSETEIRSLADRVMAQAGAGHTDDAYGALAPYALADIRSLEAARSSARSSRMAIEARLGASVGYEFIRTEKASDSLIKLSYIEKTERQPVPWHFIFYKTPAGWGLASLSTGAALDALFDH